MKFNHFYFIMCFLISLFYFLVFISFLYVFIFNLSDYYNISMKKTRQFYLFLVGYKKKKFCFNWDITLLMMYCLMGLSIGFIYESLVAQTTIILICLMMILLFIFLFKPFLRDFQQKIEIVSFGFLLLGFIFLFIIAINEDNGCTYCGSREGILCYFIIIPFFLGLLANILGFLYLLLQDLRFEESFEYDYFKNPFIKLY